MNLSLIGRHIGLYYGSLDTLRGIVLFGALLTSWLGGRDRVLAALADAVVAETGPAEVFAYTSARGALAAALKSVGIGPGDEVLVSGFTCLAVPTSVLAVGAKPVYVDIDPNTLNTPVDKLLAAIGDKTRGIIVQHTMGVVADVAPIMAEASARGIIVIEDCALATGTRINGKGAGAAGDMALFSLELSKAISTGWGGILTVRSPSHSASVRRHYATLPEQSSLKAYRDGLQIVLTSLLLARPFFFIGRYAYALGFKLGLFRSSTPKMELKGIVGNHFVNQMATPQLTLAAHQWRRLADVRRVSSNNARVLWRAIEDAGLKAVGVAPDGVEAVTPRVSFLVRDPKAASSWFAAHHVELGRWFDGPLTPVPDADAFCFDVTNVPNAASIAERIVNLPSHCGLDEKDVTRLVKLVREYAHAHEADVENLSNKRGSHK